MTKLSTLSIHGADQLHRVPDVTPPINISTTFRYNADPEKLAKASGDDPGDDTAKSVVYSRLNHPNGELVEETIGHMTKSHAVAYSSGLSAFYALMTHVNPKQLFIGQAYHGCHGIADIWTRNQGLKQLSLSEADLELIQPGDLLHIETPINPISLCADIRYYTEKAHAKGAFVSVDSTFAPLQDPFEFGADIVMHSATKYFGGHSDLLAGLLLTKSATVKQTLWTDRLYLGSNIANLEAALLLRSLKTFELRVNRQTETAVKVVKYLSENHANFPSLVKMSHSSLQKERFVEEQLKGNHSPTFSIWLSTEDGARRFPSRLKYFYHATSLGGVESLIEWRLLSDPTAPPTLLRVSIGLEDADDLIEDLTQALGGA
ncbi:hypothetical protein JCM33374_g1865 [Metschnikowia sp. JCM 33374]|nr:hypothetical protein JCM33374_g1865 [Metschnikowia sp. JCM 33374]